MKVTPASHIALEGVRRGLAELRRNAGRVASAEAMEKGPDPQALVGAKQAARHVQANVRVLQAEDEMLGTLLDVKA